MNTEAAALKRQPHPSPGRDRVRWWGTWFGIAGGPFAWGMQLLVNSTLAAQGCYPHDVPLARPVWSNLDAVAIGIESFAALLCIAAGAVAWRNWRATRGERPGDAHHLVESGDGRTRFMAMVGVMTSGLFLIAVGFAALNLASTPSCGG